MQSFWKLFAVINLTFLCLANSSENIKNVEYPLEQSSDFRLPTNLFPTYYELNLFVVLDPLPNFERFTATGEVLINVTCTEPTNQIYLHAVNLTISHDSVRVNTRVNGSELGVSSLTYELENDFFIITLNSTLQVGEFYGIHIKFVAPIPDYRLNGMYQDYYEDPESSETRYLATTLFAPYHSRRLFPNFDEPSLRAEFSVAIGHHTKYHAMANEEIVATLPAGEELPDYVWDYFRTTPSISSYITAMIVSDFTYEEAEPINFVNKTTRVYASPHLISKGAGAYAANITDAVMGFFEARFLIKYPLDKLYSVALPHFFFNAMENIGLITYKEPVLLYLKNETTEEDRYNINFVMSHELAHQWFGNIVACKWWAYVWLKEGFASFYSHYGMEHTNPELEPWEMFIPNILQVALEFDSSNASHPLENFPQTSAAVADIYTSIPYQKGASVLRMTSNFLTEDVFEQAIKVYIDRYQYQSAEQNDLFDVLQEELDKSALISQYIPASVREIMNSWCQQSNFPLIYVSQSNTSQIILTQEEFSEEGPSNTSKTWWVPITLQPRSRPDLPGTVPDTWIPQGVASITVDVIPGETVIVNPEAIGYYRVQYDNSLQHEILTLLEEDHTKISSAGRSKLISDYFELAFSGYTNLTTAMEFTKYVQNDMSTGVWMGLRQPMDKLLKLLNQVQDFETAELLKIYLNLKIRSVLNSLNLLDEKIGSTGMLHEMLIKWSCDLGSCLAFSSNDMDNFIENLGEIEVAKEHQFVIYCTAASQNSSVFEYILTEYLNPTTLFGRKQRLLKSLPCSTNPQNLKWLVNSIFTEENRPFSINDKLELLKSLAKNPEAAGFVWEKINNNMEALYKRYGGKAIEVLSELADTVNETEKSEMVKQFEITFEELAILQRLNSKWQRSKRLFPFIQDSHASLRKWLIDNI